MKIPSENYLRPVSTEPVPKAAVAKVEAQPAAPARPMADRVELSHGQQAQPAENTYTLPKRLTADQLGGIREQLAAQTTSMLQAMAGNTGNQANSFLRSIGGAAGKGKTDSDAFWKKAAAGLPNSQLPSSELPNSKLPPVANTPEGALAAISPGGAYSVDAVATRIMDMAVSMAGDDPALLEKMRDAVIKGFKAAGMDFKQSSGKALPEISTQTYDEIMKRFDAKAQELGGQQ